MSRFRHTLACAAALQFLVSMALRAAPEAFPPVKPSPQPEFHIPAVTSALDEEWVFVDTLFDAELTHPELFGAFPVELKFTHDGRGFLVLLHTVFRTIDAGETWSNLDLFPPPAINTTWEDVRPPAYISHACIRPSVNPAIAGDSLLLAAVGSEEETGYVRVIRSIGGTMVLWPFEFFSTGNWITQVAIPRNNVVMAFAGLDGVIYRWAPDTTITVDTLENDSIVYDTSVVVRWDTLDYDFFGSWVDDAETIGDRVIAAGSHHLTSEDAGVTWAQLPPADPDGVRDLDFAPDGLHGLACGETPDGLSGWARRTTDGGETWSERTLLTPTPMRQVHMLTEEIGFAAGGNINLPAGRAYRTDDGGLTWELVLLAEADLRVISGSRANAAYVNMIAAGVFPDFSAGVWKARVFLPLDEGPVLVGEPDPLIFGDLVPGTTDTLDLTIRNIGTAAVTVESVTSNSSVFVVLWDEDTELEPGGSQSVPIVFAPDTIGYFNGILSIANSAEDNAWASVRGSAGMTAVDPDAGLLPDVVELRVWPNPGNAEFRLGYDLDHAQDISLSLYDLTGRLVAVIEHGRREAGTHVAVWDGAAHASGLYFARLETNGGAVKMKKVMLIK